MFWKKYGDYVTSIFFMLISVAMYFMAAALPKSKIMAIGPDFMPKIISLITFILAALLLVKTIYRTIKKTEEPETAAKEFDYRKMLCSLLLILVYVFLIQPIGFIAATLIYLLPQFIILAPKQERTKKRIIELLITDIIFTFAVYFLFRYAFEIVLPAGLIQL